MAAVDRCQGASSPQADVGHRNRNRLASGSLRFPLSRFFGFFLAGSRKKHMRKLWPLTTQKPYTLSIVEDYRPHSSSAPFGGTFPPGEGKGAAEIFTQALWNVEKIPVENLFFKSSSKCLWKT